MTVFMIVLFSEYYLDNEIKMNARVGACGTYWERRVAHGVLVGRPEGKSPLGRLRCRWEIMKRILEKCDEMFWTGWICLSTGTPRGLCVVDKARPFVFLKMQGVT
jgi:hypothetical protein